MLTCLSPCPALPPQVPSLKHWLGFEQAERHDMAASDDMRAEVAAYYFHHYMCHFGCNEYGTVLSSIPQVMSWDDHDIFDVGCCWRSP